LFILSFLKKESKGKSREQQGLKGNSQVKGQSHTRAVTESC